MLGPRTIKLGAPHGRIALVVLYLALVLPTLILLHVGLVPNVLVFVLLGAAVVVGQARLFVRDWGVFLLVLILWQQTEGVAAWAGFPLRLRGLIAVDRAIASPLLHGALPQVWLQHHLYHRGHWQWYDLVSWGVYALHFPEPLLVGFAIWLRDRALFQRFSLAFLTLAALAFVGYIVYPAVPPWLAGRHHYRAIPLVANIFNDFNYYALQKGLGQSDKSLITMHYNLTAAMPSLHAAFPILSALYLRQTFGRRGLVMLVYAAVMCFAVVYMGEHWIIDIVVGIGCALVAYLAVEGAARLLAGRPRARAARQEPPAAPTVEPAALVARRDGANARR